MAHPKLHEFEVHFTRHPILKKGLTCVKVISVLRVIPLQRISAVFITCKFCFNFQSKRPSTFVVTNLNTSQVNQTKLYQFINESFTCQNSCAAKKNMATGFYTFIFSFLLYENLKYSLLRYLTDWTLDKKNHTVNGILSWANKEYLWNNQDFSFAHCHAKNYFCKFCVSFEKDQKVDTFA